MAGRNHNRNFNGNILRNLQKIDFLLHPDFAVTEKELKEVRQSLLALRKDLGLISNIGSRLTRPHKLHTRSCKG